MVICSHYNIQVLDLLILILQEQDKEISQVH